MDNSIRKSAKWGIYLLRGSFDLENGPFWPWGPTVTIEKVLTDIQVKFLLEWGQNSGSPKNPWTIAYENRQNGGITCSGDRLTLKMGCFGHGANRLHREGLNEPTGKILAKIRLEFQITKKYMDNSTRKSAKWGVYLLQGSFDLENGLFWLWRPTGSIGMVLTYVHVKFWQKWGRNSGSPKKMVNYSTWKSVKEGFTCSGCRLT